MKNEVYKIAVLVVGIFLLLGVVVWYKGSDITSWYYYYISGPSEVKRLAQLPAAESYVREQKYDVDTWKTYTSPDSFYSVKYPSWWIVDNQLDGTYTWMMDIEGFKDECVKEICETRHDKFSDTVGYDFEEFDNEKYINVDYYVGYINPLDSESQLVRRINALKNPTKILLGGKYPAVRGIRTLNDGEDYHEVIMTEPYQGVVFDIILEEPATRTSIRPIFEEFLDSFVINEGVVLSTFDHELEGYAAFKDRLDLALNGPR